MITREIVTTTGERKEQELNELASLLVEFARRGQFDQNVQDASEWAEGYTAAMNSVESLIMGLSAYVVKS